RPGSSSRASRTARARSRASERANVPARDPPPSSKRGMSPIPPPIPLIRRRAVLHGALGACAGFALAPLARRALAAAAIQATRATEKLAVLSGAGGNVLALSTADGLVVVDSGAAAAGAPL